MCYSNTHVDCIDNTHIQWNLGYTKPLHYIHNCKVDTFVTFYNPIQSDSIAIDGKIQCNQYTAVNPQWQISIAWLTLQCLMHAEIIYTV